MTLMLAIKEVRMVKTVVSQSTAYCSVTYLWSFTRVELGLPADATDVELEAAAMSMMGQITDHISHMADIYHNDLEITIA